LPSFFFIGQARWVQGGSPTRRAPPPFPAPLHSRHFPPPGFFQLLNGPVERVAPTFFFSHRYPGSTNRSDFYHEASRSDSPLLPMLLFYLLFFFGFLSFSLVFPPPIRSFLCFPDVPTPLFLCVPRRGIESIVTLFFIITIFWPPRFWWPRSTPSHFPITQRFFPAPSPTLVVQRPPRLGWRPVFFGVFFSVVYFRLLL